MSEGPQCAKCDYNLQGLHHVGHCPECGNVYNMVSRRGIKVTYSEYDKDSFTLESMLLSVAATIFALLGVLFCWLALWVVRYGGVAVFFLIVGIVFLGLSVVCLLIKYREHLNVRVPLIPSEDMAEVRPDLCENCDYDLTGLPQVGPCPECGNVFNRIKRTGVKWAPSAAEKGDQLVARVRTIFLGVVAACILACAGLAGANGSEKGFWSLGLIAVIGILACVTSYVSEKDS